MEFRNVSDIGDHFRQIASALPKQCEAGDPWVFLTTSAFIEYLAKLVAGKDDGAQGYKKFITIWLPRSYNEFAFKNGEKDLPEQMYHVLRCGLVHSFSLIPDYQTKKRGGRERSILLAHRKGNEGRHLTNFSGIDGRFDSAFFVAEDFVEDTIKALNSIFDKAGSDKSLALNITAWVEKHPPIAGGIN